MVETEFLCGLACGHSSDSNVNDSLTTRNSRLIGAAYWSEVNTASCKNTRHHRFTAPLQIVDVHLLGQ